MANKYLLFFSVLYAPLAGSAVITLLSTFSKTFGISREYAALALTMYIVPFALFQLFSGAIADAFSKKKALIISLGLFGIFGFVIGFAPNFEVVLIARFIMGILGSFQIPIVVAIIGEMEDINKGREFGIMTIFLNLGLALGPFISGIADVLISWQYFFMVVGALSILNSVLLYKDLDDEPNNKETIDIISKSKETINNIVKVMKYKQVWIYSIAGMLAFTGMVSVYIYLPIYLSDLKYSQDIQGFVVSITGIFGMIFGLYSGKAIDRFGRKKPLVFGYLLILFVYLLFGIVLETVPKDSQLIYFIILMALLGTGNAFGFSAINTIANEIIVDLKATVASISSAFRFTGFAFLPFLIPFYTEFGLIFFIYLGIVFLITGLLLFIPLKTIKSPNQD